MSEGFGIRPGSRDSRAHPSTSINTPLLVLKPLVLTVNYGSLWASGKGPLGSTQFCIIKTLQTHGSQLSTLLMALRNHRLPGAWSMIYRKLSPRYHSDIFSPSSFENSLSLPHRSQISTPTFQSHLSVLESSVRSYPTRPVFRTPVVDKDTSQISEWATVTYSQFHKGVEIYARHWSSILSADGIPPRSTIGLWCVLHLIPDNDPRSLTPHLII